MRNSIIDEIASEVSPISQKLINIQGCIGTTIGNQARYPSILSILNGMDVSITSTEHVFHELESMPCNLEKLGDLSTQILNLQDVLLRLESLKDIPHKSRTCSMYHSNLRASRIFQPTSSECIRFKIR
jgi:hypothetical protein